jgi:hypothetical protein
LGGASLSTVEALTRLRPACHGREKKAACPLENINKST